MNVYKVTVEFIIESDFTPEAGHFKIKASYFSRDPAGSYEKMLRPEYDYKISTVQLVPVPEIEATTSRLEHAMSADPQVREVKATNMVYDKETRRKIKRKRNHQRINSKGVLMHRYVSQEYLAIARLLSVGKFSRCQGKRCVWLSGDERRQVSEVVKERRKK
jgi:hypothetical protein|tara:strand:- start:21 stop:506 length:486 start_codon:yes stop_codon:yes gene_type:complete